MKNLVVLTSVLLAMASCKSESKQDLKSEKPAQQIPKSAAAPASPAPTKATPSVVVSAIPPLDLTMVDESKRKLAQAKNTEALAKQKAGDYLAAITLYKEALVADPGHILARYNLATAFSLSGETAEALRQLEQFKTAAASCPVCAGRLNRATKDADFASLKDNADFVRLTGSVKVADVDLKKSAQLALSAIAQNKFPASLVHPRNAIKVSTTNGNCDGDDCTSVQELTGFAEVEEFFAEAFPVEVELDSCKKDCCKTKLDPDAQVGDVALTVAEICFSTDSGMATTVTSMSVNEG